MKTEQLRKGMRSKVAAIGQFGPAVKPLVATTGPARIAPADEGSTLTLASLDRAQSSLRLLARRAGVTPSSPSEQPLTLASLERAQSSLSFSGVAHTA